MTKKSSAINDLIRVMARLRSPKGCPWDREQDHMSLRWHAVEEVYELMDAIESQDDHELEEELGDLLLELMDAIESQDDHELEEELGDLLLQVVFHCQLARERGAFDFEKVARHITDKLIRRHPHVFGKLRVKDVDQVWANWEKIKRAEKHGTRHSRSSALDGIPKHLPALLRAEKLVKKARRAKLVTGRPPSHFTRGKIALRLFRLVQQAQTRGWSAEDLLRKETNKQERSWRKKERALN